ncbi:mucin-2 [Condylostylus longicornis]|uniref:mucin-2 n=1 Tax=Condylostylus longicornis TaxID=2530218 RepID=UPI00244E19BB|nr:mucin-2 [Condylostylus longicornis]
MSATKEYSSNVVRVLHPTTNSNWDEQQEHYESKSTRNILDSSDQQLTSTNFIRQAQTNYSSRSNYSTKSNREYVDDDILLQSPSNRPSNQHKITSKKVIKNYSTTTPGANIASSGGGNVDYLDELLDDLKNERANTDFNDYTTSTSTYKYGGSSSNIPDTANINKRNEYYDTRLHHRGISSGNLIEHNPHTGATIKRTEHIEVLPQGGSTIQRSKHVEVLNSKSLETVPLLPHTSEKTSTIKRDVTIQNLNNSDELPLDGSIAEDLLPLPGTKVTTTVRTYTYEVPSVVTRTNVLYHDDTRTIPQSSTSPQPSTIINKNYSEKTTKIHDNYSTTTDTRILSGNLPSSPNDTIPVNATLPHVHDGPDSPGHPGPKRTYYYKHEVHNTKNTVNQPPPPQPYINEYHITKNTTNTTTTNRYQPNDDSPTSLRPISPESISPIPQPPVTHHTYITKTTTTNDYIDGPPRDLSPYDGPNRPHYGPDTSRPHPPGWGPVSGGGHPPVTQTYIRTHEKTTSSTMPFPINESPNYPSSPNGGVAQPPKNVNELMASLDRNPNDTDSDELRRKREIDTSVANTDNKVRVPSKNQAGPPVFYPPNSEMTLRQKEGGGAWRAQGGYAAGASGYEYQAESSSKTKSKSGAAVVPVCLPLCCAMPCVLM